MEKYLEIDRLVKESKKGNDIAKVELIKKLKGLIINSIKKYTNRQDYEGLYQDGVVEVLNAVIDYDRNKNVKFLAFIKSKLKYMYLNKKRVIDLSLDKNIGEDINLLDTFEDKNVDIENTFIKEEEIKEIKKVITSLPKRQYEVIYLYYFKKMKLKEIGIKLNISFRTVVNLKTNGLNKIKKIYL